MAQRILLYLSIVLLFLVGCSSPPEPAPPTQVEVTELDPPKAPTAEEYLQAGYETTDLAEAQRLFLAAAQAWLQAGKAQQAGAILVELDPRFFNSDEQAQYQLAYSQFYASIADWPALIQSLTDLEQRLTTREDRILAMALRYQGYDEQQDHFKAAQQLIELSPYVEADLADKDEANAHAQSMALNIWDHLRKVPASLWRQAPSSRHPNTQGWFSLLTEMTLALDAEHSMPQTLRNWQLRFPDHPAFSLVDSLLERQPLQQAPQSFAVLLPLSGPFAQQGQAVRLGVLLALTTHTWTREPQVYFFDTHQKSATDLIDSLTKKQVDFVIGPLDSASLKEFLAADSQQDWLHLALNHAPADTELPKFSRFFALDIASDALALAQSLLKQNKKGILMLAPDHDRGRQLAQLFESYWLEQQPEGHVRTGFYKNTSEMRQLVRNQLKVNQSEARKTRLENLSLSNKIEMEFRNRADIDAIYLLGGAAEARVLKPFIDVSISEFHQPIPVYANSVVHDEVQTMGESGLANIRFSDAPWLLPKAPKAALRQDLLHHLQQLGIKFPPSEQRLAAMGYDSLMLGDKFAYMQLLEGYQYPGLSGQLRINHQQLERTLTWAIFTKDGISLEPKLNERN